MSKEFLDEDLFLVDFEIKELILLINSKGIKTYYSCAGFGESSNLISHSSEDKSYIVFSAPVEVVDNLLRYFKYHLTKKFKQVFYLNLMPIELNRCLLEYPKDIPVWNLVLDSGVLSIRKMFWKIIQNFFEGYSS